MASSTTATKSPAEVAEEAHRLMLRRNRATPLIWAALQGDLAEVKAILAKSSRAVNQPDDNGVTPLLHAVTGGSMAIVEAIARAGGRVYEADTTGQTPLMRAALLGHLDMVPFLHKFGCRLDETQSNGSNALHFAAGRGHTAVVAKLLELGAKPDLARGDKWTPLLLAASAGHVEVAKLLIKAGANVNAETNLGWTAMSHACLNGDADMVAALIEGGANVNTVDKDDGTTPLMLACQEEDTAAVSSLLEAGADVNIVANDGRTALAIAAQAAQVPVARLLLAKGAQTGAGSGSIMPLIAAVQSGSAELLRLMLSQEGVTPNDAAESGLTPLQAAARINNTPMVDLLLEAGAATNVKLQTSAKVRRHIRARPRYAILHLVRLVRAGRAQPALPDASVVPQQQPAPLSPPRLAAPLATPATIGAGAGGGAGAGAGAAVVAAAAADNPTGDHDDEVDEAAVAAALVAPRRSASPTIDFMVAQTATPQQRVSHALVSNVVATACTEVFNAAAAAVTASQLAKASATTAAGGNKNAAAFAAAAAVWFLGTRVLRLSDDEGSQDRIMHSVVGFL